MYFVRVFTSGADHDPRQKRYAEYKCDVCNQVDWKEIPLQGMYSPLEESLCPSCKSVGKGDRIRTLEARLLSYDHEKVKIEKAVALLLRELETLKTR